MIKIYLATEYLYCTEVVGPFDTHQAARSYRAEGRHILTTKICELNDEQFQQFIVNEKAQGRDVLYADPHRERARRLLVPREMIVEDLPDD